jgi:hypothetical protein
MFFHHANATMTQTDKMWAVRWERYGADGVITTEGGGAVGVSRKEAESWTDSENYKYYIIPIEKALKLREKYPSSDGSGWLRRRAN